MESTHGLLGFIWELSTYASPFSKPSRPAEKHPNDEATPQGVGRCQMGVGGGGRPAGLGAAETQPTGEFFFFGRHTASFQFATNDGFVIKNKITFKLSKTRGLGIGKPYFKIGSVGMVNGQSRSWVDTTHFGNPFPRPI